MTALKEASVPAQFVFVGKAVGSAYSKELLSLINSEGLIDQIEVLPMVSQEALVKRYHQADVCFFPSYQELGFLGTPLEGMACGCVVISYGSEGSNEIIHDG